MFLDVLFVLVFCFFAVAVACFLFASNKQTILLE